MSICPDYQTRENPLENQRNYAIDAVFNGCRMMVVGELPQSNDVWH